MNEEAGAGPRPHLLRRPWAAALFVLAIYAVLALLNDDGGYLGTDTGAKVITLDRMAEAGTFSPAVGYWAEEWDPSGDYHPLFDSRQNEDGEWVNVTTLPMLMAARPLYDLGGYRAALLLPMLGSLLAAFACRDVARRLAGEPAGWWAFWVTSLASPLVVYALDLWEHSLGAGLMLSGVALLLRSGAPDGWFLSPLAAGAAFGLAATMRAEAFVVTFVAVAVACVGLLGGRALGRALVTGFLSVVGFSGPWLLNAAIERDLGGNRRTSRVSGQAQREWWTELSERADEALVTWFGLPGLSAPGNAVLGVAVVAMLLLGLVLHRRGDRRIAVAALAAVGVMYLLAVGSGLGFVPGALIASPFAVAAALGRRDGQGLGLLVMAVTMTLLTWTFQLTGGALPQWGGRYLLVPTLILTTLGIVAVVERSDDRTPRLVLGGLAVVVTLFGAAWLQHRSHEVARFFDDMARRPEDVVISTNGFLVREAGPSYDRRRYLSVGRGADVEGAVDVVRRAGRQTFAVLTPDVDAPAVDATLVGSEVVEFLGVPFSYHRYALD